MKLTIRTIQIRSKFKITVLSLIPIINLLWRTVNPIESCGQFQNETDVEIEEQDRNNLKALKVLS